MARNNAYAQKIAERFVDYCNNKNYQFTKSQEANNLRIEISNLAVRTIVNIYYTGKVVVQGKHSQLKAEIESLKENFEIDPKSFLVHEIPKIKACATKYDIMQLELRTKIKEALNMLEAIVEITKNPSSTIDYRAKISNKGFSLTLTQYNNGTLLLQGKTDKLFDDSCDLVERIANPSAEEVIIRFISSDENNLKIFAARYTPELIDLAEANVKEKIGAVYDFLESYDQKWFVASECLCLTGIPLPEFSPLVMPASKAFEGFAKKLLVGIGLCPADYFRTKTASFSILNDKNNPRRKTICDKEKRNRSGHLCN